MRSSRGSPRTSLSHALLHALGLACVTLASLPVQSQAILPTFGDTGLVGGRSTASTQPVTVTLTSPNVGDVGGPIPGRHSITFRAPAAYVQAYSTRSLVSGEQAITLGFWSRSLDPVGPTYVAQREVCKAPAATRQTCPDGPYWKRLDAGEWEVEVQVWNSVSTPARQHRSYVSQLERARVSQEPCEITEDPNLGMTMVTVPEPAYPPPGTPSHRLSRLCGVFPYEGRMVGRSGELERYVPPAIFYRFAEDGRFVFRVSCGTYRFDRSSRCTIAFPYHDWWGRMEVPSQHVRDWTKAHRDAVGLLDRFLVSRSTE